MSKLSGLFKKTCQLIFLLTLILELSFVKFAEIWNLNLRKFSLFVDLRISLFKLGCVLLNVMILFSGDQELYRLCDALLHIFIRVIL